MAWLREHSNEYCSVKREAEDAMREALEKVNFACGKIELNEEQLQGTWKDVWKKLKMLLKSKTEERRIEEYYQERNYKVRSIAGRMKDVNSVWSET